MKVDYSKILDKVKFWKSVVENVKDFTGTSPPSIFVGRAFYPKIYVGILAPPIHKDDAEVLDSPEVWYKQKAQIDQILNFRGQMIYSRFKASSVKRPSGKLIDIVQELAMSKKATDVEINLKKNPKFRFFLSSWVQPVGNPAPMAQARLAESTKIEKKVDYLVSDYDINATEAVYELYKYGIPVTRIQKIFSAGLLGNILQRKFVPTRWSITAVDDIIGKKLMEKIRSFSGSDEIRLFHNEYLGNHYEILILPGQYQYELVEIWDVNKLNPSITSDYEPFEGRKTYASNTHGAFYSGRLAVLEYLEKVQRQASVLIVREVRDEYFAPVGIWQLRETVRDAFNKNYESFSILEDALRRICERLLTKDKWMNKSRLLKILKEQTKIKKFFP
ncbi:MAG: hypothetical protein QXQ18_00495 [Candidatus Aenigmatarchaeota archaeon]